MTQLLLLFFLIPSLCFSQRYIWQRSYGSNKSDEIIKTIKTKDKGFLILAYSAPPYNFFLIKLDSLFNNKWQKNYNYGTSTGPFDLVETFNGEIILAGNDNGNSWVQCLNNFGDSLWTKRYSQGSNTYFDRIIQLSDSGFLIRYYYSTSNLGMIKVNFQGDSLWNIKLTPVNLYPLQDSFIAINNTYFRKYTNDGKLVYNKDLKLHLGVGSIYPVRSGYVLLGGFTTTDQNPKDCIAMALVNHNADTIWTGRYRSYTNLYARDVQQTADSGFLVVGDGNSSGGTDIVLLKVDKNGKMQWGKTLKRDFLDETAVKLELMCDSSIIVVGNAENGPLGGSDIMLLRIDSLPYVFGSCGLPNSIPEDIQQMTDEIKVYPNPAIDQIHIQSEKEFSGILTIHNTLGQVIAQYNLNNVINIDIPFSPHPSGLYFVTLTDKQFGKIFKKKIVKN